MPVGRLFRRCSITQDFRLSSRTQNEEEEEEQEKQLPVCCHTESSKFRAWKKDGNNTPTLSGHLLIPPHPPADCASWSCSVCRVYCHHFTESYHTAKPSIPSCWDNAGFRGLPSIMFLNSQWFPPGNLDRPCYTVSRGI